MVPLREAEVTINVPTSGNDSYYITIKGNRIDVVKAIVDIYGGYLSSYDVSQWYDLGGKDKQECPSDNNE